MLRVGHYLIEVNAVVNSAVLTCDEKNKLVFPDSVEVWFNEGYWAAQKPESPALGFTAS